MTVKTKSRPIRPSVKTFTVDVPCRDGMYDFSAINPYGRELYNERTFVVEIAMTAKDLGALQEKLSELSRWLNGSGELIFDDMPLIKWECTVSDEVIYMPEHNGTKAVVEVSLRAKPFGICVFGTKGPKLKTHIKLGTKIPIGLSSLYKFTITGSGDLNMFNFGDRPARPVMEIKGASGPVMLNLGNKQLSFMTDRDTVVDFEKQNVINSCGESVPVSGEYFEIPSGRSVLHLQSLGNDIFNIRILYSPEFIYGAHFDDMDWGDGNA